MSDLTQALVNAGLLLPDEETWAPRPLPYVSRKALKRVTNAAPVPVECPICGGMPRYVDNAEIYGGRRFGDWPYALACDSCGAYVGLHPYTDVPLGTLADKELREARKAGKAAFISLCKRHDWIRSQGYGWLAEQLGISRSECHWGWFDLSMCQRAAEKCQSALDMEAAK